MSKDLSVNLKHLLKELSSFKISQNFSQKKFPKKNSESFIFKKFSIIFF